MPNWATGVLKVRGTKAALMRFMTEGLEPVCWNGEPHETLHAGKDGYVFCRRPVWVNGMRRGVIQNLCVNLDTLDGPDSAGRFICYFDFDQAWRVSAIELFSVCKKYGVDMKIYAFERGGQFNQDIEIVSGRIVRDINIEMEDYRWECIRPEDGG